MNLSTFNDIGGLTFGASWSLVHEDLGCMMRATPLPSSNPQMYSAYIEYILAPALKPEDIVIADNLNVHESEIATQLVEKMGA